MPERLRGCQQSSLQRTGLEYFPFVSGSLPSEFQIWSEVVHANRLGSSFYYAGWGVYTPGGRCSAPFGLVATTGRRP
jgi:hypothetical protein